MKHLQDKSALVQLLYILGLMVGGVLLFITLAFIGLLPFGGTSAYLDTLADPAAHVEQLKYLQIIQAICLFIIPSYLFGRMIKGDAFRFLSLDKSTPRITYAVVALIIIAAIPFINLLGDLNTQMHLPAFMSHIESWMKDAEERAADLTLLLVSGKSISALLINLIMIAVIPALGEEMLFRGVLQPIIFKATKNKHLTVWIAAIVFSAFHLQFYGFLPRLFLGALLGYLYFASGSLWLPILAHFVNNALATIVFFLFNNGLISENLDQIGTGDTWMTGALSGGILLIIYFYLERNKSQLQLNEFK